MAKEPFEFDRNHQGELSLGGFKALKTVEEASKNRSEHARDVDDDFDAPITTDAEKWANDPSHYDFPGVDTGPAFREEHGDDFDTVDFVADTF